MGIHSTSVLCSCAFSSSKLARSSAHWDFRRCCSWDHDCSLSSKRSCSSSSWPSRELACPFHLSTSSSSWWDCFCSSVLERTSSSTSAEPASSPELSSSLRMVNALQFCRVSSLPGCFAMGTSLVCEGSFRRLGDASAGARGLASTGGPGATSRALFSPTEASLPLGESALLSASLCEGLGDGSAEAGGLASTGGPGATSRALASPTEASLPLGESALLST
mmetsp:Transcript_27624/g.79361  ORF Transcript_27624/g.79361 Transcript_27624/m.79361 type:complete len:221 (+) Transcript_27624:2223-2885(+)